MWNSTGGLVRNPSITLIRGCDYVFNIRIGGHPFLIKDPAIARPGTTGNIGAYINGIMAVGYPVLGLQNGVMTWSVALEAPDYLYYQCESHPQMWGNITVVDPVCGPCNPEGSSGQCSSMYVCQCYPTYGGDTCSIVLGEGCLFGNESYCSECTNNSIIMDPLELSFNSEPVWLGWDLVDPLGDLSITTSLGPFQESVIRFASTGSHESPRGLSRSLVNWWTPSPVLPQTLSWWCKMESYGNDGCLVTLDGLQDEAGLVWFDEFGTIAPTNVLYTTGTWYNISIHFNWSQSLYHISVNGQWRQDVWGNTDFPISGNFGYLGPPTRLAIGIIGPNAISVFSNLSVQFGPRCGCCSDCWDTEPSQSVINCCPYGWRGAQCDIPLGRGCLASNVTQQNPPQSSPASSGGNYQPPPPQTPQCVQCTTSAYPTHEGDCQCKPGFFSLDLTGDLDCFTCGCSSLTSRSLVCNLTTAQCPCLAGYYGINCTRDCGCYPGQSISAECDLVTGQCDCLPGYEGIDCSIDTDACIEWPCEENEECVDEPAPALDNVDGRSCVCSTGFYRSNSLNLCEVLQPCDYWPCTNSYCENIASVNSSDGRLCHCNPGFSSTGINGECEDVDACRDYPCTQVCDDLPPPSNNSETGRICSCFSGFTLRNGICQDINACSFFPCDPAALCSDLPAPAPNSTAGRSCQCRPGYIGNGQVGNCTDLNACNWWPCDARAMCRDLPAPSGNSTYGRTCACGPGYQGNGERGQCTEINACTTNPCDSHATCTDLPAPASNNPAGRICRCNEQYIGSGERGSCSDLNACTYWPCADNATCIDLAYPAPNSTFGRTCYCNAGLYYDYRLENESLSMISTCTNCLTHFCRDINACHFNPCPENSKCIDLPAPATNQSNGRICSCNAGYEMNTFQSACRDLDACRYWPCASNATCSDIPNAGNDTSGRRCECKPGFAGDGDRRCHKIWSCDPNIKQCCGSHGSCNLREGVHQCCCDIGYHLEGDSCQVNIINGTLRVRMGVAVSSNVTQKREWQSVLVQTVSSETGAVLEQFRLLNIQAAPEMERSDVDMDLMPSPNGLPANSTDADVLSDSYGGTDTQDPNLFHVLPPPVILQRLIDSTGDDKSPLSYLGVAYVVPFDEPQAPPEPPPRRTRPITETYDVWELILAIILAVLVVCIARAIHLRYFQFGTNVTGVRCTDFFGCGGRYTGGSGGSGGTGVD